jgi:uncharacterized repeat protein (TIGR01451 family)
VLVTSFYSASSASSPQPNKNVSPGEAVKADVLTTAKTTSFASKLSFSPVPVPLPAGGPSIDTFAGDCTTPKASFEVGDTVCVKVSGIPVGSLFAHPLILANANSTVIQNFAVTTDPQTFSFTVDATTVIGGNAFDNRGSWHAVVLNPFFFFPEAANGFTVADAANPTADTGVSALVGDGTTQGGQPITFKLQVKNYGPDSAAAVSLSDDVPANTTFVDFQQVSGPTFSCVNPSVGSTGTTTCTISSLAWPGGDAVFVATYQVNTGTPTNTAIVNSATLTSTTNDQNSGNNATSETATVVQTTGTACSFSCPGNIVATSTGPSGAVVTFASAVNIDGDCGAISATPASGSTFPIGVTTVNVTSESGPTCSFTVTVVDSPAPTISCPVDKIATADGSGFATVSVGTPTTNPSTGVTVVGRRSDDIPATYDEDGNILTPEVIVPLTDPYPIGTTGITWTVTDEFGRSAVCTQRIVVHAPCASDTQAPTITAPADITVGTGPNSTTCGVVLDDELGQAVANDDCSAVVSVSGVPAGNLFPIGTTVITYTATDGAGHTASDTQTIVVNDNTPPEIAAPPDASYTCRNEVPAASASQAHGTNPNLPNGGPVFDNCDTPTVTVSETSSGAGSASSPLIILRTFTASDSKGNTASSVQTITVIDPTPPTITLNGADPQIMECHTSYTELGATAHDNCSADFAATPSGVVDVNTVGTYTVTYNASDLSGNAATPVTRTVIVQDTTAPVITLNSFAPSLWPPNHTYQTFQVTQFVTGVSDSCDTPLSVSSVVIEKVTSDEIENGNGDGNTANDIVIASDCKSVQLRAERENNSDGRVYTITFLVRDASGNTTRATATVVVPINAGQTSVDSGVHYTVNSSCQ